MKGSGSEQLTHEFAKDPGFGLFHHFDEDGRHGDAEDEDVGQAQVEQEEIGGIAQVAIVPDDDGHEAVADQTDDENQSARQCHQEAHVRRDLVVVVVVVRQQSRVAPQEIVRLVEPLNSSR